MIFRSFFIYSFIRFLSIRSKTLLHCLLVIIKMNQGTSLIVISAAMCRSHSKKSKSWRCCKDLFPSNVLTSPFTKYAQFTHKLRLLKLSTWVDGCFWFCYTDQYFECKCCNCKIKMSMRRWEWSIWEYLQHHSLIGRWRVRGYCWGSKQPWIGPQYDFSTSFGWIEIRCH